MKLVNKVTIKSVCGTPKVTTEEGTVDLMTITGVANKIRAGESNYGAFVVFQGDFEAVNCKTGEIFRGAECCLPPVAEGLLANAIQASELRGVEFAFMISVKAASRAGGAGYEYMATPLIVQENDPLQALRERVKLALAPPAPMPEVAPTPEVSPKPNKK